MPCIKSTIHRFIVEVKPINDLDSRSSIVDDLIMAQVGLDPIQDFHNWIVKSGCMGTRGSPKQTNELFIPFREVEKYLSERKVQTLLKVVHDTSNIPPGANTVLKKCKRVFCILLLLGKGKLIQNFC
jgi:hypothetical protein